MIQVPPQPIKPYVTDRMIDAEIASVWYMNPGECMPTDDYQPPVPAQHDLRRITLCFIVLKNGFTVVGHAAVAHQENFNLEMGRSAALGDAVRQIWPLLGFRLKEQEAFERATSDFMKGVA